jgi:hypothetical protein
MVAGVPLAVVRKIGKTDYEEATAYLSGFSWTPPQSEENSAEASPT